MSIEVKTGLALNARLLQHVHMSDLTEPRAPIREFLLTLCDEIELHQGDDRTDAGVRAFRTALTMATPKSFEHRAVDVTRSLDRIASGVKLDEFRRLSPTMRWIPSPRSDDEGRLMALVPLNDMLDLGPLISGFMYVDASAAYPEHQHEPQELYLVMTGGATWRYGGASDYRPLAEGAVIYNQPWDLHGVRAGATPLLALYVLWPDEYAEPQS